MNVCVPSVRSLNNECIFTFFGVQIEKSGFNTATFWLIPNGSSIKKSSHAHAKLSYHKSSLNRKKTPIVNHFQCKVLESSSCLTSIRFTLTAVCFFKSKGFPAASCVSRA